MTLHVEVVIAGATVHRAAVVNEGPCPDGVHHHYRWVAETGQSRRHGTLQHRRSDGAAALAAAVLTAFASPSDPAPTTTTETP